MTNRPNIHEYLNYRDFLKSMYVFRKRENPRFSFRFFSRAAGFRSSNFLKLVMDGKRNLSLEAVHKFSSALKLTKEESGFFESLVLFNQAENAEEKNYYYGRIAQSKRYTDSKPLDVSQYAYFSNWHFVAMRELVLLDDFQEDPKWINRKLKTRLHPEEIAKAFKILIALNLLRRDHENRLRQTVEKIVTTPEMGSLAVVNFHREMLSKASDALEKSATVHRDISALTVSISKKQFERIRDRIAQFRAEIHAIASEEAHREAVYQLNFQLFNLTEVPWK